jgi:N-acetylneuraminate synthase
MINVVAEIGINHNGVMARAKDLIKHLAGGYVTHVKFQKMNPELYLGKEKLAELHPNPRNAFGDTYREHKAHLELSAKQHAELKSYAEYHGLKYAVSVCDDDALKEMVPLKPDYLKIPSALANDLRFINKVATTWDGKIHISLGMTSKEERERIYAYCLKFAGRVVFYHCTSDYSGKGPIYMPDKFDDLTSGFSCHYPDTAFGVVAASRGAKWLEYHTTFDRESKGTDHCISLTIPEIKQLGKSVSLLHKIKPRPDSIPENEIFDAQRLKK